MADPGSLTVLRAQDAEQEGAAPAQENSKCSLSPEPEQAPKAIPGTQIPLFAVMLATYYFPA